MNKKMIKGFVLLLVGLLFGVLAALFFARSRGTALLYASAAFGLYYSLWPVLLLLALPFCLGGIKSIRKHYVKKEKAPKVKAPKAPRTPPAPAVLPPAAPTQQSFHFCGKCGQRNAGSDQFCGKCGEPL